MGPRNSTSEMHIRPWDRGTGRLEKPVVGSSAGGRENSLTEGWVQEGHLSEELN